MILMTWFTTVACLKQHCQPIHTISCNITFCTWQNEHTTWLNMCRDCITLHSRCWLFFNHTAHATQQIHINDMNCSLNGSDVPTCKHLSINNTTVFSCLYWPIFNVAVTCILHKSRAWDVSYDLSLQWYQDKNITEERWGNLVCCQVLL